MFNLFGKKKDKNYFLEIEQKTEQTTEVSSQVSDEAVSESKVATTITNSKVATPQTVAKSKSGASSYEPPEWVKAIKNYSNTEENKVEKEINFASKYLMGNMPLSRRTAGPSLNSFKAMASSIKKG